MKKILWLIGLTLWFFFCGWLYHRFGIERVVAGAMAGAFGLQTLLGFFVTYAIGNRERAIPVACVSIFAMSLSAVGFLWLSHLNN